MKERKVNPDKPIVVDSDSLEYATRQRKLKKMDDYVEIRSKSCGRCKGTGVSGTSTGKEKPCENCLKGLNRYPDYLPIAYEFEDESLWEEKDVLHLYPEVIEWLSENNIKGDFTVHPIRVVGEDNGDKWCGYMSMWNQLKQQLNSE